MISPMSTNSTAALASAIRARRIMCYRPSAWTVGAELKHV
jgi:hypothetical protein